MSDGSRERLTVVFPGALGDFLLALPALRAIRERHAGAPATLVVSEPLRGIAAASGGWDVVASLDGQGTSWLFGGTEQPSWLVRRPHLWSWLGAGDAQVRRRLAAVTTGLHLFSVERGPGGTHAAVAYAQTVRARFDREALIARARVSAPVSDLAETVLATLSAPVLAVHPGAGAREKRWDAAGFVQVAHWWAQRGGAVVEIVGPAEASDAPLLGSTAAREWPLTDLAALLARVTGFLGNDSGVGHLAAAVGASGVTLFGPTAARRWRPTSRSFQTLTAARSGAGGMALDVLPVSRVIGALRRLRAGIRESASLAGSTRSGEPLP